MIKINTCKYIHMNVVNSRTAVCSCTFLWIGKHLSNINNFLNHFIRFIYLYILRSQKRCRCVMWYMMSMWILMFCCLLLFAHLKWIPGKQILQWPIFNGSQTLILSNLRKFSFKIPEMNIPTVCIQNMLKSFLSMIFFLPSQVIWISQNY